MADEEDRDLGPSSTPGEIALDAVALVSSAAPYLGGPVSALLSAVSFGRKLNRVREVLKGVAEDLQGFRSEATEKYVQKEEFEDLLEQTLRRAADEANSEQRRLFRAFLTNAIKIPAPKYDEQIELLRIVDQLQVDHVRVLQAMTVDPGFVDGIMGSIGQTLRTRLPDLQKDHVAELVARLETLRLTSPRSLATMMTAQGAADLRSMITPLGSRFMRYVLTST